MPFMNAYDAMSTVAADFLGGAAPVVLWVLGITLALALPVLLGDLLGPLLGGGRKKAGSDESHVNADGVERTPSRQRSGSPGVTYAKGSRGGRAVREAARPHPVVSSKRTPTGGEHEVVWRAPERPNYSFKDVLDAGEK